MSTDYGEKERQFLETLKADTGRALDEWMAAISAEGLAHRNDIIDWLRRQGFMFSKASWLERIFNNGGRPIYDGSGSSRARSRPRNPGSPRPRLVPTPERQSQPQPAPPPAPIASPPAPVVPTPAPQPPLSRPVQNSDPAALEALLAKAKAFRPLAIYVVAEIRKAVPGVAVIPLDGAVAFRAATTDFALLTISSKELRLGVALKSKPADVPFEASKLAIRGAAPMSHVTALTDARQITPALMAAVARASTGG